MPFAGRLVDADSGRTAEKSQRSRWSSCSPKRRRTEGTPFRLAARGIAVSAKPPARGNQAVGGAGALRSLDLRG
jgi:hypothetical protein